ncbi:MAG: ATP-binding cassette domain-containing protein [Synergistaceae bacterium]|nr:ATP-binding cassette domain-containing protein [Synergistaceae bacterium]
MSLYVDVHKTFGKFQLDVELSLGNEELALLGASGSGKSLTLSCIAGIVKPDRGKIIIDGVTVFDSEKGINIPPQKRHTGLMFQNYALFPNMTVYQNLRAGQRHSDTSGIADILSRFGLEEVKDLYPSQISGGQQQRTALARMLLSRPKILMLDEPFSALDSHLRFHMERELLDVFSGFGGSVILVSHSRDEAFRLCRRVAVVSGGHIDVEGAKNEVFADPKTRNAAILTGCKNISRCEYISNEKIFASDWGIELVCREYRPDTKYIGIRMHSITHELEGINCFECRVVQVIENPFSFTVMLIPRESDCNAKPIGWEMDKNLWQKVRADYVKICLPPENILLLKE